MAYNVYFNKDMTVNTFAHIKDKHNNLILAITQQRKRCANLMRHSLHLSLTVEEITELAVYTESFGYILGQAHEHYPNFYRSAAWQYDSLEYITDSLAQVSTDFHASFDKYAFIFNETL